MFRIVFIIPPIYEDLLLAQQSAFRDYWQMIRASAGPRDLVIDFTSEEFVDFRKVRANFGDGVHLRNGAADVVVARLNDRINDSIAQSSVR